MAIRVDGYMLTIGLLKLKLTNIYQAFLSDVIQSNTCVCVSSKMPLTALHQFT